MSEINEGIKNKIAGPIFLRPLWLKFFEPTQGEMRTHTLFIAFILSIGACCVFIYWLGQLFPCDKYKEVIGYVEIALADITAGGILFVLFEHRITNREFRFQDERNLSFAVSRVRHFFTDASKAGVDLTKDIPVNEIKREIEEMIKDPSIWQFYGSESLRIRLAHLLQSNLTDKKILLKEVTELFAFAEQLTLMSIKDRRKHSSMAITGDAISAKSKEKLWKDLLAHMSKNNEK